MSNPLNIIKVFACGQDGPKTEPRWPRDGSKMIAPRWPHLPPIASRDLRFVSVLGVTRSGRLESLFPYDTSNASNASNTSFQRRYECLEHFERLERIFPKTLQDTSNASNDSIPDDSRRFERLECLHTPRNASLRLETPLCASKRFFTPRDASLSRETRLYASKIRHVSPFFLLSGCPNANFFHLFTDIGANTVLIP